jgi:thioredoxin reductase (NADPH)
VTESFEVVVLGAGAAGLSAGLAAARRGLRVVVIDGLGVGGQVLNVLSIEDYPGIVDGIAGIEFGPMLHAQAEAAGAEFRLDTIDAVEALGGRWVVRGAEETIESEALIVATGSTTRALGVAGEAEYLGRGVSHCASCDGPLYAGREIAVVGGGDSAAQEAMTLATFASHVAVVFDGPELTAQAVLREQLTGQRTVELVPDSQVEEILGDGTVTALRIRRLLDGSTEERQVAGVFVYVGLEPTSSIVADFVELDTGGHIVTDIMMQSSCPGIFAAGDVRSRSASQLVTAAGDGATAAIAAFHYLGSRR